MGGPAAFAEPEPDRGAVSTGTSVWWGVTMAPEQPVFLRASAIPGTGTEDRRAPRPLFTATASHVISCYQELLAH